MGFSLENGYTPLTIMQIMDLFRQGINAQFGTTYTTEAFEGSNFYKYFYAIAQRIQADEIKASEIFLKLQNYIDYINARVSRPVNTNPGIVDRFTVEGFTASVKPMIDVDAGKIHICVDVDDEADDYADIKGEICQLISEITVAGGVTQGTEVETIVLSNGQAFDFKFNLPNRIPIKLRLTITVSENNQIAIDTPDNIKAKLLQNMISRYKLGKNFEPQRYYSVIDAPWAASVHLEYSDDDGATWEDEIFDANYDDLFTFGLEDITLVET